MRSAVLIPTLFGLAASPAIAQDVSFVGADLSYNNLSVDGGDASSLRGSGDVEVMFDSIFFGAFLDSNSFDFGGDDLAISTYGLSVGYVPLPGALVGAGLTGASLDSPGDNDSANGYEAFAQYDAGQFAAALRYEEPTPDETDLSIVQVFGQAQVSPGFTVGAIFETFNEDSATSIYYLSADYDAGPVSVRGHYTGFSEEDSSIVGVRGHYDFGASARASAGIQIIDAGFGTIESYNVGGGYMVAENVWVDASVGFVDGPGGEDITSFGIGLSYEMGEQVRLDRQMTNAVRKDFDAGILGVQGISLFGIGGRLLF